MKPAIRKNKPRKIRQEKRIKELEKEVKKLRKKLIELEEEPNWKDRLEKDDVY